MTANRGQFISFEGIDGAGKTTHVDALCAAIAEKLAKTGRKVVRSREPGGTALAEKLRDIVLHDAMDAVTEAMLVFAARRDHVLQVIEPALARGDWVLCDRFTDATFAYQGGGRGVDWELLQLLEQTIDISRWATAQKPQKIENAGVLKPDATVWFDLPSSVAAQRLRTARLPDRFESQPSAFFEAVREAYTRRAEQDAQRFMRINADQPREQVWADLQAAAHQRGWI
jgi:dTMP kinase